MYKELVSPVLDRLDSETWHVRAREALHLAEATPFTLMNSSPTKDKDLLTKDYE